MLQNMKCVLGLFMLCLLACTENKYAGVVYALSVSLYGE